MPTVKDVIVRKPTEAEKKECSGWPIWTCGVSTFDWDYTQKETCLILAGKVTAKDRPGSGAVSFGPGDFVVFPNGLKCTWQVAEAVKKHYNFE
ncbi:MAG: cupin domain-containing protein [Planctomycetes bacterium]|nr:cupin domain-containing protein [Planctomycetota bacterium]MBU1518967.1 cupin domain-containing protein [Planctomycetota bacterium]MBU2457466.1 cupin domain-containing protein [Planctomycetota bacterium]